jgi:DNA repair exonuclease SbcCD ATPase subunit
VPLTHPPRPPHPQKTPENSASLADALRAVMATRREQDNFQLMVITHDEHFAHLIGE